MLFRRSSLLMTNDHTSVFVEVADWAFERREVEIAYQEGANAAIKSGQERLAAMNEPPVRVHWKPDDNK